MSNCGVTKDKDEDSLHQVKTFGWAATDSSGTLSPFYFFRRATGEEDVRFKVMYCGICYTDIHFLNNHWGLSFYPLVPGHEIVGVVTEVGSKVRKYKRGDRVGVGCMISSCRTCELCSKDMENYCPELILTYSGKYYDGTTTYGGYSSEMVANQDYVVKIPDNLSLHATAPLLCAGITVYSPFRYFGLDVPGLHVGVVGLGGLGHLAVQFAKSLGLTVTVISTSPAKHLDALQRFGANSFLNSHDPAQIQAATASMDGIIDTVSAAHPIIPLLGLLKTNGKLIMVGAPEKPLQVPVFPLLAGRKMIAGSGIGGMKEMQEMLDFAAKHDIKADVEVIPMDYVNTAIDRLAKGDVRYRFVIDVGNTLHKTAPLPKD